MIVNVINFITDHYNDFFAIIGGIVSVASLIVKLTPTPKDDIFLDKAIKFLSRFSVFNSKKDEKILKDNK